jgi:signal peptidase I
MFSTFVLFSIYFVISFIVAGIWAIFLYIGLRWAKSKAISKVKIISTAVFSQVVLPILLLPFAYLLENNEPYLIVFGMAALLLSALLPWLLIRWLFRLRFLRAVQAWLPTLLTNVFSFLLIFFVTRPYFCEAYVCPTNSMAPTILGYHLKGTCNVCGGPVYSSPAINQKNSDIIGATTICRDHFHTASDQRMGGKVYGPDRFIACKFFEPRRWDIIVFYYPENPLEIFAKRLIGLPGEQIQIDDGKILVNGDEVVPPEHLRDIKYASEIPDYPIKLSGTKDNPARLAGDEYFVLGDFSLRAKDSRMWQQGVDGHHAYGVPKVNIIGVVTHIYWPPSRMRIFR